MTKNPIFRGAATALVTPLNENGIDYVQLKKLIDWQIDQGIDALVIAGTTGEGSTLTDAEHRELFREAIKMIDGRVPAIAGTGSNDTAYAIGRRFILPVLTHHTKAAERKEFLENFRQGSYPVLVTSKVLNEGVDVPEAAVGIVISGSGSTREHVQRLGRILRSAKGKQAELFELVSRGTGEVYTSDRRRSTRAYRRKESC